MGQAVSSQRHDSQQQQHQQQLPHQLRRQQRHDTNPGIQLSRPHNRHAGMDGGDRSPVELPASGSFHISPAPSLSPMSRSTDMLDTLPERAEASPLMPIDLGSHNTSTSLASAASSRSRQSTASRLGSRILPNSVVRGLLNSGEETLAEGRALRSGLFSRSSSRPDGSLRFPSFNGLSSRGITRRRSMRGPYPLPREAAFLPDSPQISPSPAGLSGSPRLAWRHRARLSQVRNSITSPISQISQIFGHPPPSTMEAEDTSSSPHRQSRASHAGDADHLLPLVPTGDAQMDFNEPHELDSVEPAARGPPPHSPPNTGPQHSARLRRREEQTPLSRILHLAAAAIAAQLTGGASPADPGIQTLGNEGLGGPLESLLQSLHGVTTGQADDTATQDGAANEATNPGGLGNVNFLRVFRFVNSDSASGGSSGQQETSGADQMDVDGQDSPNSANDNDRRLLTLVVVGVRSMPTHNGASTTENGSPGRLNVESLLPLLSPTSFLRNERRSTGLSRRPDRRSRSSAQRHSLGSSPVSSNFYNNPASSRRQSDAGLSGDLAGSLPTTFTESPPGPNPPPSTPAESNLSRVASGANTPNRRPSSASAFLPQLNEDPAATSEQANSENFPRQRRRSDSEAARHRGLGSGAARRNGVVEPDNPDNPSQATTRSWLIYVIGTNLAENHPAFATPSLFTDNPTYEDMILLSSLLGPAKPPVASQDDVASAGGLYRLTEYYGSLVAESLDESDPIPVPEQDRCLICLADYEAGEEIRRLTKCKHLYHRECIDEWLLTGRNSCPLCRGEGVSEAPEFPTNGESDPSVS